MAAERVSVSLGQAVIPPFSLGPSQFTKVRLELQSRANQHHLCHRTGQGQEEAMPTGTGVSDPGTAEDWAAKQLGHFPRMAGQASFSLQEQDSLLSTHPDLEFSRIHQTSRLGGLG